MAGNNKPLDSRVLLHVTPAVALAAVESGVAKKPLLVADVDIQNLEGLLGPERELMRKLMIRARQDTKRIVLAEGDHPVILRAAHQAVLDGIAILSFSNFGSTRNSDSKMVQKAVDIVRERQPDLIVDAEMQADTAVDKERLKDSPFCRLKRPANVLLFPNLVAANVADKLLERLGGAKAVGPLLMGTANLSMCCNETRPWKMWWTSSL